MSFSAFGKTGWGLRTGTFGCRGVLLVFKALKLGRFPSSLFRTEERNSSNDALENFGAEGREGASREVARSRGGEGHRLGVWGRGFRALALRATSQEG